MRLPDFAASDATRRFNAELLLEHLEEASFLYEQRRTLFDDPSVTWLRIEEFERRLAAHLDALALGGESVIELCRERAGSGEPGEVFAAVCVFCRQGRRDQLGGVLKDLDPETPLRVQAVSDALQNEMPLEWAEALVHSLNRGYQKLIPILARYFGFRRHVPGRGFDELLENSPPNGLSQVVWAIGRAGTDPAMSRVGDYVDHQDAAVRTSAVIALLRRGNSEAATVSRARALRGDPAMCVPLAVSGGRSGAVALHQAVLEQKLGRDALIALGVLGDLGAVRLMIDRLGDDDLAPAATTALELITGAGLREDAFIPEIVSDDELFDDEIEARLRTGEVPMHPDGRPFGVSVNRASRSADAWLEWIDAHASEFVAGQRYRLGKPFSLRTLVDTLVSPSFGRQVRSMAYEELVVRYGIDLPFEPEMRVREQKAQINAIARTCRSREASIERGAWYFAGRVTS